MPLRAPLKGAQQGLVPVRWVWVTGHVPVGACEWDDWVGAGDNFKRQQRGIVSCMHLNKYCTERVLYFNKYCIKRVLYSTSAFHVCQPGTTTGHPDNKLQLKWQVRQQ